MFAHLVAFGLLSVASVPSTGTIDIPTDAIATVKKTAASGGASSGIPLGATMWERTFDPADRAPYAFNWAELLDDDEKVATIEQVTMSALGASLGVQVDTDADRLPKIDPAGRLISIWVLVNSASQANAAFSSSGQQIGIAMRIRTTAVPYRVYERTAVLLVRQQ